MMTTTAVAQLERSLERAEVRMWSAQTEEDERFWTREVESLRQQVEEARRLEAPDA